MTECIFCKACRIKNGIGECLIGCEGLPNGCCDYEDDEILERLEEIEQTRNEKR